MTALIHQPAVRKIRPPANYHMPQLAIAIPLSVVPGTHQEGNTDYFRQALAVLFF